MRIERSVRVVQTEEAIQGRRVEMLQQLRRRDWCKLPFARRRLVRFWGDGFNNRNSARVGTKSFVVYSPKRTVG